MKKIYLYLLLSFYGTLCAQTLPAFHDTRGAIEVNGGGQLQYTLPIALPPGIKSVAPQMNLVYTSGSGNGIAGYGWNLSGVTSISRTGKNIEKDGEAAGIKLDYSDYYSFNGQRLILTSGTYGADSATYTTEKYSNVKIKSVGNITGQAWQGPEYWEVTFEDGSQAWYGGTATGVASAARTPLEYNIVKWKDAQGNYITYNYSQTANNVAVVSSVQWGGNETISKAHFNTITFNYSTRNLSETSYVNGVSFTQNNLLNNIVVTTNGSQFKKYVVTYGTDIVNNDATQSVNYQFVKSIQEYNSNNEPANPVTFATKPLVTSTQEKPFGDFNNIITTGDYNGDGLVDFVVMQPAQSGRPEGYYLYFDAINNANSSFVYLGASSNFFPAYQLITYNIKSGDNYIKPMQGLLLINDNASYSPESTGDIELKYYSVKSDTSVLNTYNNPLQLEFSKTIAAAQYQFSNSLYPNSGSGLNKSYAANYKEIDIDSDGLSELVFSIADSKCVKEIITPDPPKYLWDCSNVLGYRYIVIDSGDIANNTFHTIAPLSKDILSKSSIMDFDNDGKQDIMLIEPNVGNTNVTFYVKDTPTGTVQSKTYNTPINNIEQYEITKAVSVYSINKKNTFVTKGLSEGILYGDLNGDKNIEILMPIHESEINAFFLNGWSIYLNNGKSLSESIQGLAYYRKYTTTSWYLYNNAALMDINNDGKSELVNSVASFSTNTQTGTWWLYNYREFKYNPTNTQFKWSYISDKIHEDSRYRTTISPIFSTFRVNSAYSKVSYILKEYNNSALKLFSYSHYNLNADKSITSITQGGLTTDIDYKELDPAVNPNLYAPAKKEQYPYMELDRVSQSYAVSQLRQAGRKQDFRYRGMLAHLQGRGMVGFRQTARSSWYADGYENTKVWSGSEMGPLNDGLPIKEWSIRTNDETQVFPTDISVNNTQLLSVKQTTYQTDKLLNGVIQTGAISDADKPKIVTAIVPINSTTKDFLKDITTVNTIAYGSYYLPSQTVSNINSGYSISTTDFAYIHNPNGVGKDYYIGRPSTKTETVYYQPTNDTKSAKVEYAYNANNLLGTQKTWNRDNTGWILETYTYDAGNATGFGNITQKVVSNSLDANTQTTKTDYEALGRFVTKKTDNLGLITTLTYNNWGQVLTQTDPFGVALTNTYDYWGKLMTSKTNLSGTTTYTYEKLSDYSAKVTESSPDGNQKIKYTNNLGQDYKATTKAFENTKYISSDTQYDVLGRKIKESEPYFEGAGATQWNTLAYDDTVFPAKVTATAFSGKIMETSVLGRTTYVKEVNGYTRTTSKTTDAAGYVVSSTDKGGTISFTYNAAGEQLTATYGTNVVATTYDNWGRRVSFNDPANGLYKYEYNDGFGKLTKEVSPKGYKQYAYKTNGLLNNSIEKSNDGTSTDKAITVGYNAKWQATSKTGTANGKSFSSTITYDAYGRPTGSTEQFGGKTFFKNSMVYDAVGRLQSYTQGLTSSGTTTSTGIVNVYSTWDGTLYQMKQGTTNKVLWELQTANAKGQVLTAKLGAAQVENTYSLNGFISTAKHSSSASPTILSNYYMFDSIKNELTVRYNYVFGLNETFSYDNNNRLIAWTNPLTGSQSTNVYDDQGRIIDNDQIGTVTYGNAGNIYRPTQLKLNPNGTANYGIGGTNILLQNITYNENNDPIKIRGRQNDYAFEYGLTESRQVMNYGGKFEASTSALFTKYYSESGDAEVVRNNTTGQEKHILYIGGTPYESNVVYLKNYTESSGSFKFLHKDYLGSILAVSDEYGYAIEQRHYDAWGNFTNLKIAGSVTNPATYTGSLLIDRGYTSHEHLLGVQLIHMNGRLYDPLLRRFLNADENIQDPYNTQVYNKYGYVTNNPLMYNDPNGEFFFAFLVPLMSTFWATVTTAAIIGAGIGLASYALGGILSGQGLSLGGALKSMFFGAVSGAVTFGIGNVFASSSGTFIEIGRALMHGFAQGILSLVQGQDFGSGFFSAALGSLGTSGFGAVAGDFANKAGGQILFGAVAGGIGAELTGGNFWQGAITGGVVAGLNHVAHSGDTKYSVSDDGDGDCPTCPKNAKEGQTYSVPGGKSRMFDTYVYKDGEWVTWFEANAVYGTVDIGPASGGKFLFKMMKKPQFIESSVEKIGKFWKYTAKLGSKNGNGSYTIVSKYLNSEGKTIRWFHDTYDKTGAFIHRGWTEGSTKVHLWWNGIKQYGEHFFQSR